MTKKLSEKLDLVKDVQVITKALGRLGFEPILIGGMALVVLGSRRVTQDFDFVIAQPADALEAILDIFYDRGFELASKVDDQAQIVTTFDNRKIAKIRMKIDAPTSVYFLNPKTGLRIDLLFDFPMTAQELAAQATEIKIRAYTFQVASEAHLLRLKEIAKAARTKSGDAEDIAFLQARKK
jgi:hypothetical protein